MANKKISPVRLARRSVARQHKGRYVILPIDDALDDPDNENEHSDEQLIMMRASVREFGQIEDALIDKNNRLVGGHCLKRALKLECFKTISCKITTLEGARRSAYRVGTNQLARLSHFNPEKLQITAREISEEMGVSFNPFFVGFTKDDWELILTGKDWHGTPLDLDSIPDYDPDSETFLIKIENIKPSDKDTILQRVGRALRGTEYEARAY